MSLLASLTDVTSTPNDDIAMEAYEELVFENDFLTGFVGNDQITALESLTNALNTGDPEDAEFDEAVEMDEAEENEPDNDENHEEDAFDEALDMDEDTLDAMDAMEDDDLLALESNTELDIDVDSAAGSVLDIADQTPDDDDDENIEDILDEDSFLD